MKHIFLTIIALALSFTTVSAQQSEIIEGKLYWNLHHFEGFYGEEDSIVQMIEEHVHTLAIQHEENEEAREFLKDYRFLKANDLLYKPCQFLLTENNKPTRFYFTEADMLKIDETKWFRSMKVGKKRTYLKMKVNRIKEGIYFCEEILEIIQK